MSPPKAKNITEESVGLEMEVIDPAKALIKVIEEENNDRHYINLLLDRVTNINNKDNTPLHCAAHSGNTEVIETLLKKEGIDANIADSLGRTALHFAAYKGHTACVKKLLPHSKIEVNQKDKDNRTALDVAIQYNKTDCMDALLKVDGIEVDQKNLFGRTALHIAAWEGNTEVINALLDAKGIDVNQADSWGRTALRCAVHEHLTVVNILLNTKKIDVNEGDRDGWTPLLWALHIGNTECVKALLQRPDIDVNKANKYDEAPLHRAALHGRTDYVRMLLAAEGIKVNEADDRGNTALHSAVLFNNPEVIKLLLKQPNIDVNQADVDGNTPLLTAKNQEGQRIEKINLLQACGAGEDKAAAKTAFEALDDTGKLSVAYYYYFQQNTELIQDFFQALDGETRKSLIELIEKEIPRFAKAVAYSDLDDLQRFSLTSKSTYRHCQKEEEEIFGQKLPPPSILGKFTPHVLFFPSHIKNKKEVLPCPFGRGLPLETVAIISKFLVPETLDRRKRVHLVRNFLPLMLTWDEKPNEPNTTATATAVLEPLQQPVTPPTSTSA